MTANVPAGAVKHRWVRDRLRSDVDRLPAHSAMPTERELAEQYAVSRATVRKALRDLEASGLVYRVQGSGTFVAAATVSKTLSLTSFSEDMRARGLRPGSRVIVADRATASAELARDLAVPADAPLVRLVRLRLADDQPMCIETTYLNADDAPELLDAELPGSLYEYLAARGLSPVRAEQTVRAVTLDGAEAGLLALPPTAAALKVHRIGYDTKGRPVECTTSIYRADRYELDFTIRREAQ